VQRLLTAIIFGLCIGSVGAEPVAEKKPPFAAEKIPGGLLIAATPELAGVPKAWVWYAPDWAFGEAERWMTERFLEAGISVATGGGAYGGPAMQRSMNAFYDEMTEKRGYGRKPILVGRSQGGLTVLGWAVENPDKVAGFAGIYPVCSIAGWKDVKLENYGIRRAELASRLPEFNPVDRLASLVQAKVPLYAVHGDMDTVVPLELNSGLLKDRYAALGGTMHVLVLPGQGHSMNEGFFQCEELVDFVKSRAAASKPAAE
jgi:pimeloyl-ACP methyl ester carboxylesterase